MVTNEIVFCCDVRCMMEVVGFWWGARKGSNCITVVTGG